MKLLAALTVIAAGVSMIHAAHYSRSRGSRAGSGELMFGLGSLSDQEVSIDGFSTLDADQGTTFDVRFQFHFTDNIGIQVEGMTESETTKLRTPGFFPVSDDTTTGFFIVNAMFHFVEDPISPYVAVGVGSFHHNAISGFSDESGGVFDAAVGIDGRTRGPLVWAFEARYLTYDFQDFVDSWKRYQFSGQLGFRF
jgi:opacity protein-like surface antigen